MDLFSQIFDWDDTVATDPDGHIYEGITLKVPLGQFSAGTEFDSAEIDFTKSTITFTWGMMPDNTDYTFNLKLTATDAPLT